MARYTGKSNKDIYRGDNLMPKAFRFAQSGRSMVEMLGTLAVMGVLSIGGIMGYSYAMDKYRANEVMNDVNLRAIDLIAQASRGGDLSLDEWPSKTVSDYGIGLEVDTATNTTEGGIYVDKVPQRVCEIIADGLVPSNVDLTVNGVDYADSCTEENKMVFYYVALDEALGNGNEACKGPIVDGVCQPCEGGSIWNAEENACLCPNGCPVDAPVKSDGYWDCVICPQGGISQGCSCSGCPENYWFYDLSAQGGYGDLYCKPCPEGSTSPGGFVKECTCETGTFFSCWSESTCNPDSDFMNSCGHGY